MEVNKSGVSRTRVLAAALSLGVIIGAFGFARSNVSTPSRIGAQETQSPEEGVAASQSTPSSGISLMTGAPQSASHVEKVFVANPTEDQMQVAWKQSTTRMKYLDHCEKSESCVGFDMSQPYSYDLDVRRQTAQEIRDFTALAREWMKQRSGRLPEEAQTIARYFLSSGNDDVKIEALKLIDLAPPSLENFRASLAAMKESASAPLMTVLMKSEIIKLGSDPEYSPVLVEFLKERMQRGGEAVRRELAKRSYTLMNDQTDAFWASQFRKATPGSVIWRYLSSNVGERNTFKKGG